MTQGVLQVIGVPFGGGNRYSLNPIRKSLGGDVDFVAVELPGRGARVDEPLVRDAALLAEDILQQLKEIEGPTYVLYGHCMSGLLVFLMARKLRAAGMRMPEKLLISGCTAPSLLEQSRFGTLDKHMIRQLLLDLGLSSRLVEDDDFYAMMEPVMLADIGITNDYVHELQEPLAIPIVLIQQSGFVLSDAELAAWQGETSYPLAVRSFEGRFTSPSAELGVFFQESIAGGKKDIPGKWFEDEELWEMKGAVIFNRDHIRFSFMEVHQLMRLTGVQKEASVLDLCCGVGRHSLSLARSGCRVTGVDITGAYLEKARAMAGQEGLDIEYIQADARTFRRDASFDLVINMFTSFGYFETVEEDELLLENCHRSLRPGGKLLIELLTRETVANQFRDSFEINGDGYSANVRQQISGRPDRLSSWWTVRRGEEEKEVAFSVRLYSVGELTEMLGRCGFGNFEVYGDLRGGVFGPLSKNGVIVCEKQ